MAHPAPLRLAVLAALATTGCTVQLANPLITLDPSGLPGVAPTPDPVRPSLPPLPPRPTDPDGNGCEELGAGSPSIVFPGPEPVACPAIYPPPPGCEPGARQGVYGEFAGLRAPAVFKALKDARAVRERLKAIYYMGPHQPGASDVVVALPVPVQAPAEAAPGAAQRRVVQTLPLPSDYLWSCLREGYPELAQAFLAGQPPIVAPSPPPEPEPWSPEPCLYAPGQTVLLSGAVFDGQGTPFSREVEVRVASPDYGFNATAEVVDGQWQVAGAPAGVRLQVTAVHLPSGEARRRFVVPQAAFVDCGEEGFATVNFGGPPTDADPLGHRYAMEAAAPEVPTARTALTLRVFDVAGRPLPGAVVTLRTLAGKQGYKRSLPVRPASGPVPVLMAFRGLQQTSATVLVDDGEVVVAPRPPVAPPPEAAVVAATFEDVPADEPLEAYVEAPGHSPRQRTLAPLRASRPYTLAFGGPATRQDPLAPQFGLVPVPTVPDPRLVVVSGQVFAQATGAPVNGGGVRFVVEGGRAPYVEAQPLSEEGTYTFKGVPAGSSGLLVVEAPGFERVTRRVFTGVGREAFTFNFGGPSTRLDPLAPAFGLVELIRE
ncbi:MAG: carboxypeptidase-like regulatory domain-containing protein [Candidatus Sericytochromatia bacterium]|nr:carboxypeptidase-like regulatory domain-containing protein [Candidatus Sericytochromatia bacterium]